MSDLPPGWEGPLDEVRAPATADSGRRGSMLVAAGILLSRIAGLLREVAISGYLGVGATADVFKAALRIPNLLQNLLGEGVLSASFIPVYSRLLERDRRDAQRLAGAILGLLIVAMGVLIVAGVLLARPLTILITPGFSGERLDLATDLLRIMFPGIGFLVLSAFCTGILNSHRQFFLSYVSPVMWNLAQIAFVVTAGIVGASDVGIAEALAWGVLVGGILQVGVQVPAVRRLTRGMRVSADRSSPEVKDVLHRFGPVVVGRGRRAAPQLHRPHPREPPRRGRGLGAHLRPGALPAPHQPLRDGGRRRRAPGALPARAPGGTRRSARRLAVGLERITFYVAPVVALYLFAGDVVVGALFQRGQFEADDSRLVWFVIGGVRARAARHDAFAPPAERPLRPRSAPSGRPDRGRTGGAGCRPRSALHVPARSAGHRRLERGAHR